MHKRENLPTIANGTYCQTSTANKEQLTTHFNTSTDLLCCSALARAMAPVSVRLLSLRLYTVGCNHMNKVDLQ